MPASERSRSGVSLGRVARSFLFFLFVSAPLPSPSAAAEAEEEEAKGLVGLALEKREAEGLGLAAASAGAEGQSRDQWPGRPHLKQPVGAAAAMAGDGRIGEADGRG